MSNSIAIAAVTTALRDLLDNVSDPLPGDPVGDATLSDASCIVKPPNVANKPLDENHLNLFLYQVVPNAAMRNLPLPGSSLPNEMADPPLALNLFYMLTAFGKNDDDVLSHRLLGRALALIHDHSILLPADLQASLEEANVHKQVEKVRISPHTLSAEEISKLWTVFQAPYRLSVALQVSVVLIESSRTTRTGLPVMSVGLPQSVAPSVAPFFPELGKITLPLPNQPSARLGPPATAGDALVFTGAQLDGTTVTARFKHPLRPAANSLTPAVLGTATAFTVQLPDDAANWPAGIYSVDVAVRRSGETFDRTTNTLPLPLAPRMLSLSAPPRDPDGATTFAATVRPPVLREQQVSLLIGGHEFSAKPRASATPTANLEFPATLPAGTYFARIRIDGVDSLVIDYSTYAAKPPLPPKYDTTQQVTVT